MDDKEDLLYDPKGFVCTELKNDARYFEEYSTLINEHVKMMYSQVPDKVKRNALFNQIDSTLTKEQKRELERTCSPENLTFDEEVKHVSHNHFYNPTSVNFEIPKSAEHLEVIGTKRKWFNKFGKVFPYRNQKPHQAIDPLDQNLTANSELVFVVKDYHPFKSTVDSTIKKDRVKCNYEIAVLGTQTLADLRDKITCSNDMGYSVELKGPEDTVAPKVKEDYPSGFIFIENCFYNDMRNVNAIDYSEPIRNREHDKNWTTGFMDKTRLIDLKVRLGYPYVYQHQGDCEHIIVFADVRLLRETDPLDVKAFPYFQYESRYASSVCFICGQELSKYVAVDGDYLPNRVTYLCEDCLVSYNYKDGRKIGRFTLYSYFDRACLS